jgi:hypothetical protein
VRPKKKNSLCVTSSLPKKPSSRLKQNGPFSEPADLDTSRPSEPKHNRPGVPQPESQEGGAAGPMSEGHATKAWLDDQMALLRDHDQIESEEDARLSRCFLAIVAQESARLELAVTDDEARAATVALRKDLALGLIQTPEAGRELVPMTIEALRLIGLGHPSDGCDNP